MAGIHPTAIVEDGVTVGADVEIGPYAVVRAGTVLGDNVTVGEHAVLGKRPKLGPKSVAKGGDLPGLVVGAGSTISTHAIVYAGTTLGERVIIGRGVTVENDTAIGEGCRVQSQSYITAKSLLEDDVFIAPCVVTTNDNFMGRTEKRHALLKGPTIRRGARIGGAVCLCPGIEIGEEAFIGAGAVVTKDVPAGTVMVGVPARVLRDVPEDELRVNGG